jgi:hypothetical protein
MTVYEALMFADTQFEGFHFTFQAKHEPIRFCAALIGVLGQRVGDLLEHAFQGHLLARGVMGTPGNAWVPSTRYVPGVPGVGAN